MADIETDVAIIGAGTAGLAAERHARKNGATTRLIDPAFAGTTCATVGCMPSKLLIAAAEVAHSARHAAPFGIELPAPKIDGPKVMGRLRNMRDNFVEATKETFEKLPDGVAIKASAHFTGPNDLKLSDGRSLKAKAIIIATGSAPVIPPPFEGLGDRILTNETLFELPDLPKSVGVMGAGPIGLELAQALARLGVRVGVFDIGDTLGGLPKGDVETSLRDALEAEFPIYLDVDTEATKTETGVKLSWSGKGARGEAEYERVLVSAGRAPQLDALKLETTGLELDGHGTPVFDANTLQCGSSSVFIAGDANHRLPVLHEASAGGTIAGVNAATFPDVQPMKRKHAMQVMFTDPNLAVLGAPEEGEITGRVDFSDQGRAKVHNCNQGVCEIYARQADGLIVGARMVAPNAEHLAHLIAWSIERGATANELLDMPFYHPTLEEGLKTALQDVCKQVGSPVPPERDDEFLPGDR
ncbi:dihydrolipoyl dehydrogenase [Henriciella litoralis]|uniref:dihydrolipoyl dehydrogenase n=1 Tax=Henriciella litoralis TaxID=568102 RepID=UPI000A03D9BA|nr:dihydrolipoyl dehydrogenase [Henriciella litoralis]